MVRRFKWLSSLFAVIVAACPLVRAAEVTSHIPADSLGFVVIRDMASTNAKLQNLIRMFGGQPQWCFASVMQNGKPVTAADVREGPEGIGPLAGDAVQSMYRMPDGSTAFFGSHRNMTGKLWRFGLQILG